VVVVVVVVVMRLRGGMEIPEICCCLHSMHCGGRLHTIVSLGFLILAFVRLMWTFLFSSVNTFFSLSFSSYHIMAWDRI
jgi:cytochrome b